MLLDLPVQLVPQAQQVLLVLPARPVQEAPLGQQGRLVLLAQPVPLALPEALALLELSVPLGQPVQPDLLVLVNPALPGLPDLRAGLPDLPALSAPLALTMVKRVLLVPLALLAPTA